MPPKAVPAPPKAVAAPPPVPAPAPPTPVAPTPAPTPPPPPAAAPSAVAPAPAAPSAPAPAAVAAPTVGPPKAAPAKAGAPPKAAATAKAAPPKLAPLKPAPPRKPERKPLPALRPIPKVTPRAPVKTPEKVTKVTVDAPVTVKSLSAAIGVRANLLIARLMRENVMVTINEALEDDVAGMLGLEHGVEVTVRKAREAEDVVPVEAPDKPEDLKPRAPIVTFLGHVDHGKTSLLDSIRQTHVAAGEAGGITQHIGAYRVVKNGKTVVFLDTPGHQAFTAMRARGAHVTDVVVLVVAADDGVMPQTEEAVNHAKAANVPIVVALNKIDKPEANPLRTKQQLANLGLIPEEWGGETVFVETSAVSEKGLPELIEMLSLVAEMRELRGNPTKPATGTVLEAKLHEGRGVVATLLVQNGTLRPGDVILCGSAYGRVRAILDDKGVSLELAGPATPVEVSGLSSVPEAGDRFQVLKSFAQAREVAEAREAKQREAARSERKHVTLETLYASLAEEKIKEVRVVLKADVMGSIEVLKQSLGTLAQGEVRVRILHAAVGSITESDVLLADASDAVIIGFDVVPEEDAGRLADQKGVEIRPYRIIYEVMEQLKAALEGMLAPEEKEVVLGNAEVRKVYRISKIGNIAGCYVRDGRILRNALIRLLREGAVVYSSNLDSLRIVKDDVREVRAGFECGIKLHGYDDIKEGDIIQAYEIQKVKRKLG
ncbi:MAG: translation initiation factor IF-2 [Planctomycetes bacterium]|nr:translation initiation factor IF-2 [Planctomycetota bacterium]